MKPAAGKIVPDVPEVPLQQNVQKPPKRKPALSGMVKPAAVRKRTTLPGETPAEQDIPNVPEVSEISEVPVQQNVIQKTPKRKVSEVPLQQKVQQPPKRKSALSGRGKPAAGKIPKGKRKPHTNKKKFKWAKTAKGHYSEQNSVSEEEVDDPGYHSQSQGICRFMPNVTYVIYEHEGTHFPGLVVDINGPDIHVSSMRKGSHQLPDAWEWPEQHDIEICSEESIAEIIEAPRLTNNRDSRICWVPEMKDPKYSWSKTVQFKNF